MCGIAGYVGKRVFSEKLIENIKKSMRHRGPDSSNYHFKKINNEQNIIFFHSRLSIIDP